MLEVRWLGSVNYNDAYELQHRLFNSRVSEHLLLMEHNHVYTLGVRGKIENLLVDASTLGADVVHVDRGGDITYHGPGQLVGYPIINVPTLPNSTPEFVFKLEQLVIETLARFQIEAFRNPGFAGVWVQSDNFKLCKIAAVGVRISTERSMHGFALNVAPAMDMFDHIVPCGISQFGVTSMSDLGVIASVDEVACVVAELAPRILGFLHASFFGVSSAGGYILNRDVAGPSISLSREVPETHIANNRALDRRLASAGVSTAQGLAISSKKPEWMRLKTSMGEDYRKLKMTMREFRLVTVCEEAKCPNIYECWSQGTATFMINGSQCTRACGFCHVDTSKPLPLDRNEPQRVAEAVKSMGLEFAVITAVARDDLADGGISGFVATIDAIREMTPMVGVEVLIPDLKGRSSSLQKIYDSRPAVLNHNIETVVRLQRAVRPQASYARSLRVLAGAVDAGLTTKSGIIVGMGETVDEIKATLRDLWSVGVEIVTIGQYLRPTKEHLPVARWYFPDEFVQLKDYALELGIRHVEASPNTRSSYHAKDAGSKVAL